MVNSLTRLRAGMDPNQFKLLSVGLGPLGMGAIAADGRSGHDGRARANFTILGVGNNPGIHIIAFGSILFSIGIPWAFYFKPYLVRREKRRLAELHKGATPREAAA